ncbi:hypothetical protein B7494_g2485 [Chlorociboria aeruginascens]|nr:hypothetical protein B7494_g2485 [Chlorociboria aeruginascens]
MESQRSVEPMLEINNHSPSEPESDPKPSAQPSIDQEKATTEVAAEGNAEERTIHGIRWWLIVISILASTFLFALDTTVVADVQANIVNSLGNLDKYPWLGAAFVLPAATLQLPWTKSYSLFNIKWLYIFHVLLFEVGSAIAGAAPSMDSLIVGRAIAGIGGSGMYVGGMAFFAVLTTPKERPIYISLITPTWGLGTVLGPLVGGAFADSSATWRWGFYINLCIAVIFAPIILFALPSIGLQPTVDWKAKMKRIDWLGVVMICGFGIAFIMALTFGGSVYAWKSSSEIILWIFSGLVFAALVLSQKYHPFVNDEDKLYPSHVLKNWKLGILQFSTFACGGIVYIPIYYIPLYFQFAKGETALASAVKLLPFVFMIVALSLASGFLTAKLGYIMPWFCVGAGFSLIGSALMYTLTPETGLSAIYGYSCLIGIGGGCFLMTAFGVAHAVVRLEDTFDAIGCLAVAQGFGITFFISVASLIFQNVGIRNITPLIPSSYTGDISALLAGSSSTLVSHFPDDVREQITAGIIKALDRVYTLPIASSSITFILSFFILKDRI